MFGNATIDALDWSPTLSFPARAIYTGDIPFWGVYMSSIKMSDGFSVDCQPSCAAVIDSGTSLMSLPSVMVYSLLDQIGNDYTADCSTVAAKLPEAGAEVRLEPCAGPAGGRIGSGSLVGCSPSADAPARIAAQRPRVSERRRWKERWAETAWFAA